MREVQEDLMVLDEGHGQGVVMTCCSTNAATVR